MFTFATKSTIAGIATAGLSAAILGLAAPAFAVPSGGSAEDTISQLESQGSRVVVTNKGSQSLSDASVVSVTHGGDVRHSIPGATSNGDTARSVSGETVYVTVK